MAMKPTYEELELRVKELEEEARKYRSLGKLPIENEKRYRDLFENAPISYFSISAEDGSILRCNTEAFKLLGYDRDTLMGMKVFELYADNPHGIPKAKEVFKQFKEGKSIRDVELQMKHTEGHPIWISLSIEPVKDHKENITESRSTVIDISKRKRLEEDLRKKRHDLCERVKELNCLYSIGNLVEQLDISLEKILQGIVDLIPPSWQYPEITCARVIIQDREWKTKSFRETIWKQASDINVHGELSGNLEVYYLEEKPEIDEGPFIREERNLINVIAKLTGRIVERKQGEEALRASEDKYRNIFENIQDVYYEVTLDGIILEISPSIEEASSYKREELIGQSLYNIYVDSKERDKFLKKLLKNGKVTDYEILLKDKDDSQIYCSITAKLIRDKHGNPIKIIGSMHNINERKKAEDHIHNLSQMLIKAQERERQMISYELHDRIAQNLSWLKIGCDTFFKDQSDVSSELIEKMKTFSKLTEQTIIAVRDLSYDLRPPGMDEVGIIPSIQTYCEEFSEKSGLEVDFQSAGIHKLDLDIDTKIHLYRLIQEGLNNIRKHADADRVVIKLVGASPNIVLRIEDNGKGFDVMKREVILGKDKRMGLRSMKERVNLLGGEMTIQSQPREGTKILIKFPFI